MSSQTEVLLHSPEALPSALNRLTAYHDLLLDGMDDDVTYENLIVSIPLGRFNKTTFFRVHPEKDFTIDFLLLDLKDTNESYFVTKAISDLIPGLTRPVRLYLAVDTKGNFRFIPVPLTVNGQTNPWHLSLEKCVLLARAKWIRMHADMTAGSYGAVASNLPLAPQWPKESFEELLNIATAGKIIRDKDHPVILQLLGEAVV